MRRIFQAIAVVCLLNACSVYMAAKQEDTRDMTALNIGTPRSLVLGKLGQPTTTEKENGLRTDYFNFTQGYSGGAKAARAAGHGVMDVLTLGLWEIAGTSIEGAANGDKMSVEVIYDKNDKLAQVKVFKNGELIKAAQDEKLSSTQ